MLQVCKIILVTLHEIWRPTQAQQQNEAFLDTVRLPNTQYNVYGAVIITKLLPRFTRFIWWTYRTVCQAVADPAGSNRANWLGSWLV